MVLRCYSVVSYPVVGDVATVILGRVECAKSGGVRVLNRGLADIFFA